MKPLYLLTISSKHCHCYLYASSAAAVPDHSDPTIFSFIGWTDHYLLSGGVALGHAHNRVLSLLPPVRSCTQMLLQLIWCWSSIPKQTVIPATSRQRSYQVQTSVELGTSPDTLQQTCPPTAATIRTNLKTCPMISALRLLSHRKKYGQIHLIEFKSYKFT